MGLEAIDKVDRARERSKNLKGPVKHDFRVGARIAKQACLALCQYASRYGATQATTEALAETNAKALRMEGENSRLRKRVEVLENTRLYLLKQRKDSRGPSPVADPAPLELGTKRSVDDRRGVSPVRSPSVEWAVMDQDPPNVLIPEVVMAEPAGEGVEHNKSMSPMARFAAADP